MKRLIILALASLPLSVSAATTLDEILARPPAVNENPAGPDIRFTGLRDTAMAYGAQAGLAYQNEINLKQVLTRSQELDVIYNFGALMIDGVIVPPVLTEASNYYDQQSPNTIRLVDQAFNIEAQARFSYVAPDWRQYVLKTYMPPNSAVLMPPKDEAEVGLWKKFVKEGFEEGQRQAKVILQENFARLSRDFSGMALSLKLMNEGKITRPFVASSKYDVTGKPAENMNIGDMVLKITANPEFVHDKKKWK